MNTFHIKIEELLRLLKEKDIETYNHSLQVGERALSFSKFIGMSKTEQDILYYSGLLHDIGKIFIPDKILRKTSSLTKKEFEIIKKHPLLGYNFFTSYFKKEDPFFLSVIAEAILYHHVYYNKEGGYPILLPEKNLSFSTFLISLCDVYEAVSSKRPYKDAFSFYETVKIIKEGKGVNFHPELTDLFLVYLKKEQPMKKIV